MALISRTGGTLRVPSPPGLSENIGGMSRPSAPKPPKLFDAAGRSIARTIRAVSKSVHPVVRAPKPSAAVQAGQQLNNPAASGGSQDPFQFIKTLLVSTNPADAKALVDQVYAPLRQQYLDQIAQIDGMAKARADQMNQVYQGFAQYLQGMPGQIQQIYGQSYQSGQQAGQALAGGMAGPQGAVGQHLQASADINTQLEQTLGKNWASYAAAMPGIYSLMATQNIKSMLGDAQASETKLREDLLSLSSKEASDILAYLQNAQTKDTSLQEWAYGQKQTMDINATKAEQARLDYLQKQQQIDFNQNVLSGKMTLAQAEFQYKQNYNAQLYQLKKQGLISENTYRSALLTQGDQRIAIAKENAATAKTRAATAKTGGVVKAQANVAKLRGSAASYATSLRQSGTGSTSTPVWIGPNGQVSTTPPVDKKGKAVKGWAKSTTSTKNARYSKAEIYNLVYRRFAPQFFAYYRTVYPNVKNYQSLVDKAIRLAVGYGPNG